jgi:hypothetical protein
MPKVPFLVNSSIGFQVGSWLRYECLSPKSRPTNVSPTIVGLRRGVRFEFRNHARTERDQALFGEFCRWQGPEHAAETALELWR